MLAALFGGRTVQAADSPLPLFLAPRQADDALSPEMWRASQRRLEQRAPVVANPRLKWQPYRPLAGKPQVAANNAHVESGPAAADQTMAAAESVVFSQAQDDRASQIATSDPEEPRRRVIPRPSRSLFRSKILRVSSDEPSDQFNDPFSDVPMPSTPAQEPSADESYPSRRQTRRRAVPDSSEPMPINPAMDPFTDENTSPPTRDDYSEPPFVPSDQAPAVTCETDKRECESALKKIRNTTVTKLNINVDVTGQEGKDFPCECELTGDYSGRNWGCTTFTWKASTLCHKPLYFEEVQLERYGHALNPLIGPLWSGAHFFLTIPTLPYQMSMHPLNECEYVLGYYRPGSCAPWLLPAFPVSVEAGLLQAAAVVGGILLIP